MKQIASVAAIPHDPISQDPQRMHEIVENINRLKVEKNAIILAHNYQYPEVQDIADYVGDSLGLSQMAAKTDADTIVFCGVHFMAETAAMLSPQKTVLLPDLGAGCSLADTITAEQLRKWKAENPGAVVVSYVNTTAEVKAESDYCCTSGNAEAIIRAIDKDQDILFCPDMFLGTYLESITGRKMKIWMGECHVHAGIHGRDVNARMEEDPEAELLIHPECGCASSTLFACAKGDIASDKVHVLSTATMITHPQTSKANSFIVATESGVLHPMQRENPSKTFVPVSERAICKYMKMITLEKVERSLRENNHVVAVDPVVAAKARQAIERMIAIT